MNFEIAPKMTLNWAQCCLIVRSKHCYMFDYYVISKHVYKLTIVNEDCHMYMFYYYVNLLWRAHWAASWGNFRQTFLGTT